MRLLDQVAQATNPIIIEDKRLGLVRLPGADAFAALVRDTTLRYVLQDDVTQVLNDLAFGQASLVASSLDIVRLPSESMWIEWQDIAPNTDPTRSARLEKRRKVGALVTSEPGGRVGSIQVIWEEFDNQPTPSPAILVFDLDNEIPMRQKYLKFDLPDGDLRQKLLFSHLGMFIQPQWLSFYRSTIGGNDHWTKLHNDLGNTIRSDAPFVLAFCLLLSMRTELTFQAANLSRLNEQREKRKKPTLLDHVEIGTTIHRNIPPKNDGLSVGGRAVSRLHHVRGHFVRRGNVVFWRSPHLRGDHQLGSAPIRINRLSM